MKHIYYKNDFAVEVTLQDAEGNQIAPPEWEWSVEFTDGRRKYVCSLERGNVNVADDKIICYLDNHKFCCGEISYKFVQAIPDLNYLDGFQDLQTPKVLPLELWEKESDDAAPIESTVVPPYVVYDAYMTAKAKGYQGTADEYYELLLEVGGYGEAETERVANEKQRVDNEAKRKSDFEAMQASATSAINDAKGATDNALEAAELASDATKQTKQATTDARTATDKALVSASTADSATADANSATAKAVTATERANAISADLEAKREADYWRGEKGDKGDKGEKGDNGVSPTVTTSKSGDTSVIEITDAKGTHQVEVKDGKSVDAYTKAETDSQLSTKQDTLTAGPGIVIASNIISAREEVLYDEWYYPNKKPTTDLVNFRDSYEVLQPTAYVGDYTDADGTQWTNVFECESFPDWFDWSIAQCYPYNNGIATGVLYLNSFEVTDAGEVTYYMYNNRAIGTESMYGNLLGIKKIDDTHFALYLNKSGSAIGSNNINPSTVDASLFGFGSPIIREIYDVTDCKKLRIEWSGQVKLRNQYSDLISTEGSVATGLRGYYGGQVVYGTTINDFEISDDKTKFRVTRSNNSMFYRTNVNGHPNNSGLKELSSDFVMTSRWYTLNQFGASGLGVIKSGGKSTVVVATNGGNNPNGAISMGSRLRIIKLE